MTLVKVVPRWKKSIKKWIAVNEYFESQDKTFFENGLMALETRSKKCIKKSGDYVEK